jgi:ABC-type Fe3+/spermidine/putrescine transport system ATPase subunit
VTTVTDPVVARMRMAMAGRTFLSVRGLTRDFRGFRAVDGVDLDVAEGSVRAGRAGRREDHLFNLLTGLKPSGGRIELDGRDVRLRGRVAGSASPLLPDHQPLPQLRPRTRELALAAQRPRLALRRSRS